MKKPPLLFIGLLCLFLFIHAGSQRTLAQDGGNGGSGGIIFGSGGQGGTGGAAGSGGSGGNGGSGGLFTSVGNGGNGGNGGHGGIVGVGGDGGSGGNAGQGGDGGTGEVVGSGGPVADNGTGAVVVNGGSGAASGTGGAAGLGGQSAGFAVDLAPSANCAHVGTTLVLDGGITVVRYDGGPRLMLGAPEVAALTASPLPDENTLVATSDDGYIRLYRLTTGEWQTNMGPYFNGQTYVCIWTNAADKRGSSF